MAYKSKKTTAQILAPRQGVEQVAKKQKNNGPCRLEREGLAIKSTKTTAGFRKQNVRTRSM